MTSRVMTRSARRVSVTAAAVAAGIVAAGCGSTTAAPHSSAAVSRAVPVPITSLDTSTATAAGTWAVALMGGPANQDNNFWQLFVRPAASSRWQLVTPPGTADNGGLVLAGGGASMVTAFRPSQLLTFTPLTTTTDGGRAWSALNPLDARLATTPDALAASPPSGTLAALLADGTAELGGGSRNWKTLATTRTVADTTAGRQCGLTALTAVGYTPSGVPLLAGACSRPGQAGIFAGSSGTWQSAGPALPTEVDRQDITVLRLARTANQVVALLAAGTGHDVSLFASWSADGGATWTLSPALPLRGAAMASASFGFAGSVGVIAGDQADVVAGAGVQWHALPVLPAGTATLVPGSSGGPDAMAVAGSTLTVWQLLPGATGWTKSQVIHVPIQYGSSS
jgi:hypothetical protein